MVPHSWVRDMLGAMDAPRMVKIVIEAVMPKWKTMIEIDGVDNWKVLGEGYTRGTPCHLFSAMALHLSDMLNSGGGFWREATNSPGLHGGVRNSDNGGK